MTDLRPATAFGSDRQRRVRKGGLLLTENPDIALASLALRRGAALPAPFGIALPEPGMWVVKGPVSAFWTGPDQWMLAADGRAETDFSSELAALCSGCSVTEQTDGFAIFDMSGDAGEDTVHALLSRLVNLDPMRFPAGSATRTGLEHMSVFVIRRDPAHLRILGMRSAAATLWHALEAAVLRLAEDRQ